VCRTRAGLPPQLRQEKTTGSRLLLGLFARSYLRHAPTLRAALELSGSGGEAPPSRTRSASLVSLQSRDESPAGIRPKRYGFRPRNRSRAALDVLPFPLRASKLGVSAWSCYSPLEPFRFALPPVYSGTALSSLRRKRFLRPFSAKGRFPPLEVELFAAALARRHCAGLAAVVAGTPARERIVPLPLPSRRALPNRFRSWPRSRDSRLAHRLLAHTRFPATGLEVRALSQSPALTGGKPMG
jgi:hypothetical protein